LALATAPGTPRRGTTTLYTHTSIHWPCRDEHAFELAEHVRKAEAIALQRFTFLNHEVPFSNEIGWHDPQQSHLWRFNLWGQTGQHQAACDTFQALATSWIAHNKQLGGDGWHPYTLSLRSVNWTHALLGFPEELWDPTTREQIQASLYGQVQLLASDLEFDIRGNHLLENLRALIWAGVSFSGTEAQGWLARGLKILQAEVEEQILPDGGHFERVPGYHLVMLKCLLEIAIFLRHNRESVPAWLDVALERMTTFAHATLPPDGQTALLKDTAWDTAPQATGLFQACALYFDDSAYNYANRAATNSAENLSAEKLVNFELYPYLLWGEAGQARFAQWCKDEARTGESQTLGDKDSDNGPQTEKRSTDYFPDTGYWVLRDKRVDDYLIMDVGKPGPDYLLGHAHADLLSYELTVNGERVVVDSGVYQYEAGPWRDYSRSTRAHNTVEVASANQSDVWSSFRVGQRAKPRVLQHFSTETYSLMQAEHDGYKRLPSAAIHRRTLLWVPNQFWLVFDQIVGADTNTDSPVDVASHIHLHPDLTATQTIDSIWEIVPSPATVAETPASRAPLWISAFGHDESSTVCGETMPRLQGWYSGKFGQQQANTVLTLSQKMQRPFHFGYMIAKHMPVRNIVQIANGLTFEYGQRGYRFETSGVLEVVDLSVRSS